MLGAALLLLSGVISTTLSSALGSGRIASPAAVPQLAAGAALPPVDEPGAPKPTIAVDPGLMTPEASHRVTVRAGDSVVVDGAGIGCQVNRRAGRVYIECGRTGDLAGTYMTLLGKRKVMVARLRSTSTAKVILTARHGAGWRACGTTAGLARVGGRGCR